MKEYLDWALTLAWAFIAGILLYQLVSDWWAKRHATAALNNVDSVEDINWDE